MFLVSHSSTPFEIPFSFCFYCSVLVAPFLSSFLLLSFKPNFLVFPSFFVSLVVWFLFGFLVAVLVTFPLVFGVSLLQFSFCWFLLCCGSVCCFVSR